MLMCSLFQDRQPRTAVGAVGPRDDALYCLSGSFTARVLQKLLELVKFGDTVSYQQLAALAGSPKAARAVGGAMRSNPVSWPRVEGRPRRRARGTQGCVMEACPPGASAAPVTGPRGTGRSASLPPVFGEGDWEVSPQKHPLPRVSGPWSRCVRRRRVTPGQRGQWTSIPSSGNWAHVAPRGCHSSRAQGCGRKQS